MKRYVSISTVIVLSAFLAMSFYACGGGDGAAPAPPAGVTVTETGSPASTDVTEGGNTDTYDVVLDTQPGAEVTITVTPDAQTDLGSGGGTAITLTFTSANGTTPQTVTVSAVDDVAVEGSHSSTITHVASSSDTGYNGISISDVTVNITDNDGSVTVSPQTISVTESGTTDSYDISLDRNPDADVTITVTPDAQTDLGSGAGTATTLTFTSTDGTIPQTVTVSAVNDSVGEGPHTSTIQHSASSTDPAYNGVAINDVTANITDNEACFAYLANRLTGSITSYTLDTTTGALTAFGSETVTGGTNPYGLDVDPQGRALYVTHSGSNNVITFAINQNDGSLVTPSLDVSPTGLTPRLLDVDPSGSFLYVANNGSDNISEFSIASDGSLNPIGTAGSTGNDPESVAVDPFGQYLYAVNSADSTISSYTIDTAPVPGNLTDNGPAVPSGGNGPEPVIVHPSGLFLYVGNDATGEISTFSIGGTGTVTFVGNTSQDFGTDSITVEPTGKFLYGADLNNNVITAYTIDGVSGLLTPITGPVRQGLPNDGEPFYLTVDVTGQFVYVANFLTSNVSGYVINPTTGELTPTTPATFPSGGDEPVSIGTVCLGR